MIIKHILCTKHSILNFRTAKWHVAKLKFTQKSNFMKYTGNIKCLEIKWAENISFGEDIH